MYNDFNVYCRELAPSTVSLTGDRAQGEDSKQWAYGTYTKESISAGWQCYHFYQHSAVTRCRLNL